MWLQINQHRMRLSSLRVFINVFLEATVALASLLTSLIHLQYVLCFVFGLLKGCSMGQGRTHYVLGQIQQQTPSWMLWHRRLDSAYSPGVWKLSRRSSTGSVGLCSGISLLLGRLPFLASDSALFLRNKQLICNYSDSNLFLLCP